jgi:hypothetical protein
VFSPGNFFRVHVSSTLNGWLTWHPVRTTQARGVKQVVILQQKGVKPMPVKKAAKKAVKKVAKKAVKKVAKKKAAKK